MEQEVIETTPAASSKPKRARRSGKKASKAVESTQRAPRKPARTLQVVVREQGAAHVEALRVLSRADPTFKDGLRNEMSRDLRRAKAMLRVDRARNALAEAEIDLNALPRITATPCMDRLAALARSICEAVAAVEPKP